MTTYHQTDWTGEESVIDTSERCSVCNDPLLNLRGGFFGAGRLSVYCSDACKMKAYRQRQKALRNVQHKETQQTISPPHYVLAGFESESAFRDFRISFYGVTKCCDTLEEALRTGKRYVSKDGISAIKYSDSYRAELGYL